MIHSTGPNVSFVRRISASRISSFPNSAVPRLFGDEPSAFARVEGAVKQGGKGPGNRGTLGERERKDGKTKRRRRTEIEKRHESRLVSAKVEIHVVPLASEVFDTISIFEF